MDPRPSSASEGICLADLTAAVVDRPVAKMLIGVEIDSSPGTVVQGEVPRPFVAPGIQPIHPDVREHGDHLLELCRLHPEVEIGMDSGLLTEQRVDCPAAAEAHIDPSGSECGQQLDRRLGIHHVLMHRLEPTEPAPIELVSGMTGTDVTTMPLVDQLSVQGADRTSWKSGSEVSASAIDSVVPSKVPVADRLELSRPCSTTVSRPDTFPSTGALPMKAT
jgi:hypothetical protein